MSESYKRNSNGNWTTGLNPESDGTSVGADTEKAIEDHTVILNPKAEKKLVQKISWILMPLVAWISMMQAADKSALGVSALLGIYQDVHLSGTQFSWLGSIFFIGHLVCQPVNNILLQKLPIKEYTGVCVFTSGIIMLATGYCRTFSQLMALRFLLGLFEGTVLPSVYLIINTLFRRSEQATYYGIATVGNGLGINLSALIAYGVSQMGNQREIIMWRWNHIILGAITILIGLLCFFFLVDGPKSWQLYLTNEEEKIADERTKDNAVVRHEQLKWYQMLEALTEVRFWCICIGAVGLTLQAGGLQVFNVQIINQLGDFSLGKSILLKMPIGACTILGIILSTFLAQRTNQLCYSGIVTCLFCLSGCVVLAAVERGPIKLIGLYLVAFWGGPYSILATIIGANVYGYSKKIFYNGGLVVSYTLGQVIGPLIMLERQAPEYRGGMIAFCIGNGVMMVCFYVMRLTMEMKNKERLTNLVSTLENTDRTLLDLTDKQNQSILYRL